MRGVDGQQIESKASITKSDGYFLRKVRYRNRWATAIPVCRIARRRFWMLGFALFLRAAARRGRLFDLGVAAAIQSESVPQKEEQAHRNGDSSFH